MALRQYRPDYYQYDESIPKEKQQAAYQAYHATNPNKERVKEFFFFLNIAIFSVITVIATYIYLSNKIPVFLAFLLAIATGLIGLKFVQFLIRKRLSKDISKNRTRKK
ncbi:DUF3270 domain-containing protein [Streptococcus acidominimus]|uniref:DUF3270 family protein n=1 Tax=Streptococcus acidominimus TaxID=1326 RepID=A0A1Q8EFF9_STRAI|nr:DUF3270 domain-containing protein [Streptococcus acidominimus]MBF0847859.1 DUF3270 domain-containing protein [Streptococcus danieliae]MBF0819347.1 DUF3270 domain-containing protein [Streptococcus acidominimus]MBF0839326.1 DUF3270 domain-containing protein [Streptococcus acidominimus]OLF50537.1 hypothetical protein BU200_01360 [Streptococcus acidominimus]TFU30019.1 DUF3270 family protein [Streptococcus acidominimus]